MYPNPERIPQYLPSYSVGAPRSPGRYSSAGLAIPLAELVLRRPAMDGEFAEFNRRRKDDKLYGKSYKAALAAVNRTYGRASEYAEFAHAWSTNWGDPLAVGTALALNEAVDFAYGQRARFLRDQVYSRPFYDLPIGIDALRSLASVIN